MTVYVTAQIKIHDRERYARYGEGFMKAFTQHKGTILAVDDAARTLEGKWDYNRTVLLSFPTEEDVQTWYHSAEYQEILAHRLAASEANIAIINALA